MWCLHRSTWVWILFGLTRLTVVILSLSNDRLNKSSALLRCNGELARFSDIQTRLPRTLEEGQSAWISGRVQYSNFIAWVGCYDIYHSVLVTLGTRNLTIEYENMIYSCSKYCNDDTRTQRYFMTIWAGTCLCLTSEQKTRWVAKPLDQCRVTAMDILNPEYRNDDHDHYMMYEIKPNVGKLQETYKQCLKVHVSKDINSIVTSLTDSCLSNDPHGYVCMATPAESVFGCLSTECVYYKSDTWTGVFDTCRHKHGVLINSAGPSRFSNILNDVVLWTGLFRAFTITHNERSNNSDLDICLAVTKFKGQLVYDPDACSAKKLYLCERNTDNPDSKTDQATITTVLPTTTVGETLITATVLPTTTVGETLITAKPGQDKSVPVYVFISVALLLVLVFVVCGVIFMRHRRKTKMQKRQLLLQSSVNLKAPAKGCQDTEGVELHIYDHTFNHHVDSNYDTMTSVISTSSAGKHDTTYSRAVSKDNTTSKNKNKKEGDGATSVSPAQSRNNKDIPYDRMVSYESSNRARDTENTTIQNNKLDFCVLENEEVNINEYTVIKDASRRETDTHTQEEISGDLGNGGAENKPDDNIYAEVQNGKDSATVKEEINGSDEYRPRKCTCM